MSTYYGIATNKKEDKEFRIEIESKQRHLAYQEAVEQCKEFGLILKNVYVAQGTQKGGNALTKFAAYRKKHNGENSKDYSRAH